MHIFKQLQPTTILVSTRNCMQDIMLRTLPQLMLLLTELLTSRPPNEAKVKKVDRRSSAQTQQYAGEARQQCGNIWGALNIRLVRLHQASTSGPLPEAAGRQGKQGNG